MQYLMKLVMKENLSFPDDKKNKTYCERFLHLNSFVLSVFAHHAHVSLFLNSDYFALRFAGK